MISKDPTDRLPIQILFIGTQSRVSIINFRKIENKYVTVRNLYLFVNGDNWETFCGVLCFKVINIYF
jgi:hypothetical protein